MKGVRTILGTMLSLVALQAEAQSNPALDFDRCMDRETARFERALRRAHALPDPDFFDISGVTGVEFCGTVGIVKCDNSDAPLPCQRALRTDQDVMTAQVLSSVPPPNEIPGRGEDLSDAFYRRAWELARGRSAGPDCIGAPKVMEVWCEARESNRRLQLAVLTWQAARFLGAAPEATEAGWADPPSPTRPRAREAEK